MTDRSSKDKGEDTGYAGFDVAATRRAQATADRARETAAARGEHADATYVDEGPEEAARRMGTSEESVKDSVERARKRD